MSLWRQLTRGLRALLDRVAAPTGTSPTRCRTISSRRAAAHLARGLVARTPRGAPRGWSSATPRRRPRSRCALRLGERWSGRCSPTCATPRAGCARTPGFTGGQRAHAGARHRGDDGDLQRVNPILFAAAALSRTPAASSSILDVGSDGARNGGHVRHVSRADGSRPLVRRRSPSLKPWQPTHDRHRPSRSASRASA